MVAAETALATNAVVAKAVELFVDGKVTPLVVPFSVVVLVPFAAPIVTLVVEPATPFVPISIVLVRPVAVAPDPKDKTDIPAPLPRPTLLLFAVIGPLNVVPPFIIIVLVPIVLPTVTFVVEPDALPVPMFMVLVFPVAVTLFPILTVVLEVEFVPKLMFGPLKVLFPE